MIKDYESIDQIIQRKLDESKAKKKVKNKYKTPKKNKNKKVKIIALIVAGVIALTSGFVGITNLFKRKNKDVSNNNTNKTSISTMDIGDMGAELEITEPKVEYGETTGKVDVNKIVEKNNKIYVDKESADKSSQVGNSSVNTKGGTLEVKPNGKVVEKTPGYEIKDETGKVVEKGDSNNGKVPGYEYDKETDSYLPEGYVYTDATYYNEEGNVLIEKGEVVTKDWLDYLKKNFSTKKPTIQKNTSSQTSSTTSSTTSSQTSSQTSSTTSNQTDSNAEEGISNTDGTYTIYGITFESKADYQQWVIQGGEGYGIDTDGIMKAMPDLEVEKQKTK